jgi:cobalt-zinc-cadmium resistance protein CzcA
MINRLVAFALQQRLFVALGVLLFVGAGVFAFEQLPIEAFPDVSDVQVNVIALYPGRAAEETEKQVTIPLEVALSGLPHAVRTFVHTQFGLSFVMITFDDGVTDYFARQLVDERLRDVDLPQGVTPELAPLSTAIGEIFRFRLKGDGYSSTDLRTLEDWVVEKNIRLVPGVADVVTMGGKIKQYEVNPDLSRLRDHGVTLAQLFAAISRANANAGGGAVAQGSQRYLLRSLGLLNSSADVGDIVVSETSGVAVHVRDVADVHIGHAEPQGIVGQDDADDIINGIVVMRKGENPSDVLVNLKAKITEINHGVLPPGVEIVPYYDRQWLIGKTLHTVFGNLVEGALLVMFVLVLFLGDWRAALIVALVIPLALLATFLGLRMMGVPANLLSLGAMDFGIIVDGAVIVVESILRHLSEARPGYNRRSSILGAVEEVGRPTLFSMIIIIAAHIPIFTLQRHEGRIFSPMALSVVSALIGSLVMSLTAVPVLCDLLLKKDLPHEDNRLVRACRNFYTPLLDWSLEHRRTVLVTAVLGLVGALFVGSHLGSEFLPELNEGSIWVNVNLPASVSLDEATAECRRLRAALHKVPEVDTVISKAGRPDDGTDPKPINMLEIFVALKPDDQWRKGETKEDLIKQMDAQVRALPGLDPSFSQPIRDNVLESISQIDGQIVLKLFGDDLDVLRINAEKLLGVVSKVPGVVESSIDRYGQLPQYVLEIDRPEASRYGLNVGDIQDLVETALAGKAATELWEGEKHFSVVVRLKDDQRELDRLKSVLIATPDGAHIPLSEVVHFRAASGAMNIARENGRRVMAIGVFIRDRDMGSVVADMQAAVAREVPLPAGYTLTWSGEFENQQRAMKRLAIVVPLSVLLIFVLLFSAFDSFASAGLIIANIPLAMIGGILALFITGIPLSVSAAIGFIALFGQAVLNGVVMVSYFNQLSAEGLSPTDAVRYGASTRLRTVLMTAMLAMLGLLPMALSHGIGSETQRPLAVVIIGGLISATLLTLIVLPTLYVVIGDRAKKNAVQTA